MFRYSRAFRNFSISEKLTTHPGATKPLDLSKRALSGPSDELSSKETAPQNQDGSTTSKKPNEQNSDLVPLSDLSPKMTEGITNFVTQLTRRYPAFGDVLEHQQTDNSNGVSKRGDGPIPLSIRFTRIKSESDLAFQKAKEVYYTPFAKALGMTLKDYINKQTNIAKISLVI